VDGTATVVDRRADGESLWVTMEVPQEIVRFIVEKGYIAIDGTSLTVCTVDKAKSQFSVMLIAHTQKCVVLPLRAVGDRVGAAP
jgi:riboflavin synthase